MNIEFCLARHHFVVATDAGSFCLVCDFRTDQVFAIWSQQLLARIKAGEELKKAAYDETVGL